MDALAFFLFDFMCITTRLEEMEWFLSLSCLLVLVTALPPRLIQTKQSFDDLPSSPISHSQHDPLHYFVDIEIGYPPQNMSLLVDTGSSDTWVSDPKACHNCTFSTCEIPILLH